VRGGGGGGGGVIRETRKEGGCGEKIMKDGDEQKKALQVRKRTLKRNLCKGEGNY